MTKKIPAGSSASTQDIMIFVSCCHFLINTQHSVISYDKKIPQNIYMLGKEIFPICLFYFFHHSILLDVCGYGVVQTEKKDLSL